MNIPVCESKYCAVMGCKAEPGGTVQLMAGKPYVPVCDYHLRRRLWWYRGWIFDRDEEAE
jgi:hypothetical protein